MVVLKRLGLSSKSKQRDRRPDLDEVDRLMVHFEGVRRRRPDSIPMQKIIGFAIFSTRRQEEITLLAWQNYDEKAGRIWVRDMKDPEEKDGNDVLCEITPEAQAIWPKLGGAISGSKSVPASAYPDDISKKSAAALSSAKIFRFDASDAMPVAMSDAFLKSILDFVKDQSKLDSLLTNLDTVQKSAYSG